ncbi:MAG: PorV/PorQ family protein, partial [Endomicrobiales bacterium]
MNRKMTCRTIVFLTGALVLSSSNGLHAAGGSAPASARVVPDPRSAALGDSVLSLSDSPAGMFVNPAGVASIYRPKLTYTETSYAADLKYRGAAFSFPTKNGSFGVGAAFLDHGDIKGVAGDGQEYDVPRSGDLQLLLNYALTLRENGPLIREYGGLGVNVKHLQSSLAGNSAGGLALDLGGIYKFGDLSTSLVYRNLGTGIKYASESGVTASSLNLGLRYDFSPLSDFFILADASRDMGEKPGDTSYSFGAGISPVYPVTLRCAWKETPDPAVAGLRAGISMDFKDFSLSYSYSPLKGPVPVHHAGIDISLGAFSRSKVAYNHYLTHYFEVARARYS